MTRAALLFLGLELTRFAGSDDVADALSGSLASLQSGGWTLSPYEGPALQPFAGVRAGHFEASLAPGATWSHEQATSADGRAASLRVFAWRAEARARYWKDPWFAGLDAAYSDGRAQLQDTRVAEGTAVLELGPTAGVRARLADHLDLSLRLRWPVRLVEGSTTHGPGGGLAVEWHP